MCRYISAFHHPFTGEVLVAVLDSHGGTEKALGLDPVGPYREMHYLPNGVIECRLAPEDRQAGGLAGVCVERVRQRWPTFAEFEQWARETAGYPKKRPYHYRPKPDVATEWVLQKRVSYRKGNMSFAGTVIQSYGWWDMAMLVGKRYCLWRDETYSHTTSAHQWAARRAAINVGRVIVLVRFPDLAARHDNAEWYREQIAYAKARLSRARDEYKQRCYSERIALLQQSRRIYNRLSRVYARGVAA